MTPQPIAEPAGEPLAVLVAKCKNCTRPIMRLGLESAQWRHDRDLVTCTPPDPSEDIAKGDQA